MSSPISLIGLASNDPVPGVYIQTNFAAGPASSGGTTYSAVILANKLSTGSATADTVIYGPDTAVAMTSVADAITLFGDGSEMARMVKRFMAVNKTTPLYCVAVSEGGSAVASTGTITVATTATGSATLRIFVGDEFVDTGIVTGDTPTVVATAAVININSKSSWPVTAGNSAGVITLTSKNKGLRANFIRYFAQISPTSSGTTVTPVASTACTGGSVTDVNTTALATILGRRFYYCVSAAEDATNLGAWATQIASEALPVSGRRMRLFAGSVDTLANAITISTGLNTERAEIVWLTTADQSPGGLASNQAAVVSLFEAQAIPRSNFAFFGQTPSTSGSWLLRAPLAGNAPTRSQVFSALNAGLSPIGVGAAGTSFLFKRVTTRFKNGSVVDYRIREANKVTIEDFFADDLQIQVVAAMDGKVIGDDPIKGQPEPAPTVATPRVLKSIINRLLREYSDKGLIQNLVDTIQNTIVQRETSPTNRMSAVVPLQPVDSWDQAAIRVDQVA
jgi:phage tail sheath gpL-like